MPDEMPHAKRHLAYPTVTLLVSRSELSDVEAGFSVERSVVESNNAGYRGTSGLVVASPCPSHLRTVRGENSGASPYGRQLYMALRKNGLNQAN